MSRKSRLLRVLPFFVKHSARSVRRRFEGDLSAAGTAALNDAKVSVPSPGHRATSEQCRLWIVIPRARVGIRRRRHAIFAI